MTCTAEQALQSLKRAHDAVAGINASGAYSDILRDLRAALNVLDRAVRPTPLNLYVIVNTKRQTTATGALGACYLTRAAAEEHVSTWPTSQGLRVAHLVEVQHLSADA